MSNDHWWDSILATARRAAGFTPTRREIEAELERIEAEPLTDEQVNSMVEYATRTRICDACGEERPWCEGNGWWADHSGGWTTNLCPLHTPWFRPERN